MTPPPPSSPLFPYTTLFRSSTFDSIARPPSCGAISPEVCACHDSAYVRRCGCDETAVAGFGGAGRSRRVSQTTIRSEEHTSELQSHVNLVCRLLLEKKKKHK